MLWSHFIVLVTLSASCAHAQYNITDFILGFGYPCEDHLAPTTDGWKLSLQRIPHGKASNKGTLGVVLFQHGLTDDSAGVCLNGPQESLPFILADAGYDVWLGNNRGNGQSMINTNYNAGQAEFWDFSWADMAEYDMPAQINYILQATGAQKLAYIGHSEGTTQAFAGLLNPDVSSKVSVFIALAPAVFVSHTKSPVVRALADLPTVEVFELLGIQEFALPNFIHSILPGVCTLFPSLCAFDLELIMGPTTFLNASRIEMYANWEPNPTSVKNMAHWAQMVDTGNYCQFDYGTQGNMEHYNQPTPPCYDLSTFPDIPVFIFAGGEDYLADPVDVTQLIGALPYPPVVYEIADYAHADFILGYNANQRIFPSIIKILGSQM